MTNELNSSNVNMVIDIDLSNTVGNNVQIQVLFDPILRQ